MSIVLPLHYTPVPYVLLRWLPERADHFRITRFSPSYTQPSRQGLTALGRLPKDFLVPRLRGVLDSSSGVSFCLEGCVRDDSFELISKLLYERAERKRTVGLGTPSSTMRHRLAARLPFGSPDSGAGFLCSAREDFEMSPSLVADQRRGTPPQATSSPREL